MSISEATKKLRQTLYGYYEAEEADNIADWVMESITGKSRSNRKLSEDEILPDSCYSRLEQYTEELIRYRPVQYVLNESYFYGLKFKVDERVLIPRPETEELTEWCVLFFKAKGNLRPVVLDIGTGSGCIAVSVKSVLKDATVLALDIDQEALAVAAQNAGLLGQDVRFIRADILGEIVPADLPVFDCIISNPPYITMQEQDGIAPNVLNYEPHKALFVTDNDPLQFYKAIERFARIHLGEGGIVLLELHVYFARETKHYFEEKGWICTLRKDLQGKERMLQCRKE